MDTLLCKLIMYNFKSINYFLKKILEFKFSVGLQWVKNEDYNEV